MHLTKEVRQLTHRFVERLGLDPRNEAPLHVLQNPTEEIAHGIKSGKPAKLWGVERPLVAGRLEENYLYHTRRFPNNTANNTIGAGAVAAGDYLFFTSGFGDQGATAGYFSVANLTLQQTNMAAGGKIPTGRGFRLYVLGVSCNTAAKIGNISQCLDTMNMRFEKQSGQLVLQHGPIGLWPGGKGIYAGTTDTAVTAASNGMPALTNVRRYRTPRILSANEQFQYVINAAAATPAQNTTVALTDFVEITIWLFGQVLDAIPN